MVAPVPKNPRTVIVEKPLSMEEQESSRGKTAVTQIQQINAAPHYSPNISCKSDNGNYQVLGEFYGTLLLDNKKQLFDGLEFKDFSGDAKVRAGDGDDYFEVDFSPTAKGKQVIEICGGDGQDLVWVKSRVLPKGTTGEVHVHECEGFLFGQDKDGKHGFEAVEQIPQDQQDRGVKRMFTNNNGITIFVYGKPLGN